MKIKLHSPEHDKANYGSSTFGEIQQSHPLFRMIHRRCQRLVVLAKPDEHTGEHPRHRRLGDPVVPPGDPRCGGAVLVDSALVLLLPAAFQIWVGRDPLAQVVLKPQNLSLEVGGETAQKKIAGRVSVADDQIRALLDALLAASGHRLVPARAATALAVSPVMLRGAVLHAQRLLNVEGYPVLRVDADGATVILDEAMLREQFGIRR
ncbi:MAG: hypothetical protein ACRDRJ_16310 [Streptosporangiaceae bacterium]